MTNEYETPEFQSWQHNRADWITTQRRDLEEEVARLETALETARITLDASWQTWNPSEAGIGPRGRRAAVLWPGLSRAALLVFRLGEIDDDALISLFDCQRNPPPVCAVLCQF